MQLLMDSINKKNDLPDLILLDIDMPVMDGWSFMSEFIRLPRESTKEISIYMVSSSCDDRDKMRAVSFPSIKDYYAKPLTAPAVNGMLDALF